jgi:hypothetical protein
VLRPKVSALQEISSREKLIAKRITRHILWQPLWQPQGGYGEDRGAPVDRLPATV